MGSKLILVISLIGFSGGFLVPLFGTIDHIYWGEIISGWMDLVFFLIFALFCLFGIIVTVVTKKKFKVDDKLGRYAFLLSCIGLCINGFWILTGLAAALY